MFALLVGSAALAAWLCSGSELTHLDHANPAPPTAPVSAGSRSSAEPTAAWPVPVSDHTGTALPADAASSAAHLVFSSANAVEGLRKAIEQFGRDSHAVNSALASVGAYCSKLADPRGSLQQDRPDPSRDWALESLLSYCEGYSPALFPRVRSIDAPPGVHHALREQGAAAANAAARNQVVTGIDASTVHEAALFLFERGKIPDAGIPGTGPVDAVQAIGHAARLVACEASASCGPQSPLTLSYCTVQGCTPGLSFADALRENLPPNEHALVLWYYRWMISQRRPP